MADALLNYDLLYGFLVALGIGILVGIERERDQAKNEFRVAGVRTFTLIAMLGAIAALLAQYSSVLSIALVAGFVLLVVAGYCVSSIQSRIAGQTTEVAEILVFALAYLSLIPDTRNISVMLAIVVTTLLALKEHIHGFARQIKEYELLDTLKFAVITFIVLPLLPVGDNQSQADMAPRGFYLRNKLLGIRPREGSRDRSRQRANGPSGRAQFVHRRHDRHGKEGERQP
jgi:hypothetical protein